MSRAGADLVGRDFARTRRLEPRARRLLPVALMGVLLAGLALAALRVDLIRIRYGLAAAMRQERALLEEHRSLTARVRALRDPARLARIAKQRGFAQPERVIELPPTVAADVRP